MTANQINYFKAQEEARSNRVNEAVKLEGNRIAAVANDIARRKADVDAMNANINLLNAQTRENEHWETVRANLAREQENIRTNMANENIRMSQLAETRRANQASEAITSRYNEQRISQGEATLWQQSAERKLRESEYYLEQQKFAEQQRHTQVQEDLDTRKTNQGAVQTVGNLLKSIVPSVAGLAGLLA